MPKVVIPETYRCPITRLILKQPVYLSNEKNNSIFYEQSALELWFQEKKTHPKSGKKLTSLLFNSANSLKKEIHRFLKKNQVCSEEEFLNIFLTGNVDDLEQLNYLDSYASLKRDGQSLLHMAVANKNLRMVEWLLEQGCNVNARDDHGALPIEIALQNNDLEIQHLLIVYGSQHRCLLNIVDLEQILNCRVKARLVITEESELEALIQVLACNEMLLDLTLQTFSLTQSQLDSIKTLFDDNKTLRRFDIYSEKRSYTKIFQLEIDKNLEQPTGLYAYKAALEKLDVFLPLFFEGREQEVEWVQKKTAELLDFLVFKLPFKELTLSEKEDCRDWVIYFLATQVPCETYRQLINRVLEPYVQFSLKDFQHPLALVWSEKEFKKTYLAIQEAYKDYFQAKKIRLVSLDKELKLKNYQWCVNHLIILLKQKHVDSTFLETCLGPSRALVLGEGFIPLYLKEKDKNGKRFFSKRLNRFRALIEAQEQNYICPISGQIMNHPVEINGVIYEQFYIEQRLREENANFLTKKLLPFRCFFANKDLILKIEAWRKKFAICSQEFFIDQLEKGNLKALKKLNYLEYYLHIPLDRDRGEFPICIAARNGNWDIVQWLVSKGVQLDVFSTNDYRKKTPLDWAIYQGNIKMVQWFMAYQKIDLNQASGAGNMPVWLAVSNQQVKMLDFLLQQELSLIPSVEPAAFRSVWINLQDSEQNTLLHFAVKNQFSVEWIERLINQGVDLNVQNRDGDTALHLAVLLEHVEAMVCLVNHAANLNIQNLSAETPYMVARKQNFISIQEYLILQGAEHAYLGNGQLEGILQRAGESAKLTLSNQDELRALTSVLSSTNLISLNITLSLWNDDAKGLLISAVSHNTKLLHLTISGLGYTMEDGESLRPYLKNNYIAYEKRCLDPYKFYWGPLAPLFEMPFTPENLQNKNIPEVIADLIHFMVFTLPFKKMEKNDRETIQRACHEWIIYVLFNEPLKDGKLALCYFDLLKLSFLFLLGQKSPEKYLENKYDGLVFRKDLWVWSENDFKEVYSCFKPCEYLGEVNQAPVSEETYEIVIQQMIDLLGREEEPLKDKSLWQGKMKEKETLLLLKMGFKPLYLKAQGRNAEIVFQMELNQWRAAVHRNYISSEASLFQNELGLLNWELKQNGNYIHPGITKLREKYGICFLNEFWSAFDKDPWNTMLWPNYLDAYLFCVDLDGNSLVHIAVKKQDLGLVAYLYELRCDIDSPNQKGLAPIHLAIENGHREIFEFLYGRIKKTPEKGSELLHYAFLKSSLFVVQKLVEDGFFLQAPVFDPKGRSLLYLALKKKQQDMLKYLFETWSDMAGEIDKDSIFLAIQHGYKDIILIFIQKGCSFDCKNGDGLTPLHYAIKLGNLKVYLDIAKLIIQADCDLEAKDPQGKTPLHYAKDLLRLNPLSSFWHFLIQKGVMHDSLNETELRAILGNLEYVKLSVSCQKEFLILGELLKNNVFPNLVRLDLRLYGDAFDQNYLLEALQNNRSLVQVSFSENGKDFSRFFEKIIERNQWIAHLMPYEDQLRSIGIKWEQVFLPKKLAFRSVSNILAEEFDNKILQLPLNEFSLEEKQACYQWVIKILSARKPIPRNFKPLIEKASRQWALQFEKQEIELNEGLNPDRDSLAFKAIRQYQELQKLHQLATCMEETFPNLFKHLQQICFCPDFLKLPPSQRISFISKPLLVIYKLAGILSDEDYWKGKNKKKLNAGIQLFKEICLSVPDDANLEAVLGCLETLKQTAMTCLKKEAQIVIAGIKFFPVLRDNQVTNLYQYLANLNLEDPDTQALDEILGNIWHEVPEDLEMLNIRNGIGVGL